MVMAKTDQPRAVENYGKLPLSFEVNRGQADGQVKFLARGQGYTLFLTSQEAVLSLQKSDGSGRREGKSERPGLELIADRQALLRDRLPIGAEGAQRSDGPRATNARLQMKLVGANSKARVQGEDQLPGKSNYFIGNDPKKWRTNIPTYAKVRLENVYPGVDLVYYGNQGQLEYDFVLQPGSDPSAIKLALGSAASLAKVDADGDLVVQADGGEVRFHKPVIYQPASADKRQGTTEKTLIAGGYTIDGQKEVAFTIGDYDRTKPLVIDPSLVYSTYLGGGTAAGPFATTSANAIAVDGSGSAYVTGSTATSDFPTTSGAFQTSNHSATGSNAFVAKFSPDGSTLLYSTYLGGSGGEIAYGIAVDGSGNAYLTGSTGSTDFPTFNPFQATGRWNANFGCRCTGFVTKLNATGTALVYSTYLGGSNNDAAAGIAVDSAGNAYVAGATFSADFPTANAIQPTNHSHSDPATNGFVTEFNASGSALVYSTYLGGSGNSVGGDENDAIAVDGAGNAYVTGYTRSTDFPTTPNALQPTCSPGPAGCNQGFVTKINVGGTALAYSTYLAPAGLCDGIAVDGGGNAYVTGVNAIVAKLNPDGSTLIYFNTLTQGGNGFSWGRGIAVDGSGNAYVIGYTEATNFPTANPLQEANHGNGDAFVTKLAPDGSRLVYSTYLGGSGKDQGNGIAVDASENAYVTGFTSSGDFPTAHPYQATNKTFNGSFYTSTGFVAKISDAADLTISNGAPSVTASGTAITYTITVFNNGPDTAFNVNITDAIPAGTTFASVAVSSGSCTAPPMGGTGTVTCTVPSIGMNNGDIVVETLAVNVAAASGSILDTATVSASTFDPKTADNSATATTSVVSGPVDTLTRLILPRLILPW
jgi:uncharacterized repeat protein (TIGR01451 family)